MKRILTILTATLFAAFTYAQKPADLNKSVVSVITYDAAGNVLHNAYGFFCGATGEVVAAYAPFKGAASADIINWQGQKAQALRIVGASSEYDLVRFTTDIPTKKLVHLEPAASHAERGAGVQVALYTTEKKSLPSPAEVTAADLYNDHYYYELSVANEDRFFGCPVLDAEGHVVAIVQKNVQKDATTACAIDMNFAEQLTTSAVSVFNSDLNDINIPKLLPQNNEEDAYSYIYILMQQHTAPELVLPVIDDFIAAYPANTKIYNDRATYHAARGDYAAADADLAKGIACGGEGVADVYNLQSKLIYNKLLKGGNDEWPSWNIEAALEASQRACQLQPEQPLFNLQQGHVLFFLQRYQEAYDMFQRVNASDIATAQTFYFAVDALDRAGGDPKQVIALLDSAVNRLPVPHTMEAAPYILARAQYLDNAGLHSRAVIDFNDYEHIVGSANLNDYFFYMRMQSYLGFKRYEQAIADAMTAINRATDNERKAAYTFELGCVLLQAGEYDDCIAMFNDYLQLAGDDADAYKFIGLAYAGKNQKKQASQYLQKAKSLGAEGVDELMAKYL